MRTLPFTMLSLLLLAAVPSAAADTLLVANKADATLSFVDLPSGEVVATLPTGAGPHEVAVSPDGTLAVVADYGGREPGSTLTVIDVPGAQVVRTVDLGRHRRPHGITFLDARRVAVTAEGSGSLLVVDVVAGEVVQAVATGHRVSHMVAVAPGGSQAWVTNLDAGNVTVVDLAAGEKLADVATGAGAEGVAISPDGRWVWVTNRAADTVSLIDAGTREKVADLPSADFPIRAEVTSDGRWVLVTNAESGDLTVIDAEKRQVARRVALPAGKGSDPIGLEIAPDGKRAWIAHTAGDLVQVLDLETGKPAGTLVAGDTPDGMAYSPVTVRRPAPATGDGQSRGEKAAPGGEGAGGAETGAGEQAVPNAQGSGGER